MSYEKLREECNRRLPQRINEECISVGCEVLNLEEGGIETVVKTNLDMPKPEVYTDKTWPLYQANYRFTGGDYTEGYAYKILGTPLTIADVLRVLSDRHNWNFCGVANEQLVIETGDTKETHKFIYFNLAAPLSDPSNAAACEAVLSIITKK